VDQQQPTIPSSLECFRIKEDAVEPLRQLKQAGFFLIVITNQPGLSRGSLSRRDLDRMHALLQERFRLDDILVCPHDENDRCPCRKPRTALFLEAAFKWHLDLEQSFVVSDKWQDATAAQNLGCTSLLIESPWNGLGHHDFILPSLAKVVDRILRLHSARQSWREGVWMDVPLAIPTLHSA
jgi:D-glycero-D-manno-heptose 1,7-bisphosphate phosphatase